MIIWNYSTGAAGVSVVTGVSVVAGAAGVSVATGTSGAAGVSVAAGAAGVSVETFVLLQETTVKDNATNHKASNFLDIIKNT